MMSPAGMTFHDCDCDCLRPKHIVLSCHLRCCCVWNDPKYGVTVLCAPLKLQCSNASERKGPLRANMNTIPLRPNKIPQIVVLALQYASSASRQTPALTVSYEETTLKTRPFDARIWNCTERYSGKEGNNCVMNPCDAADLYNSAA